MAKRQNAGSSNRQPLKALETIASPLTFGTEDKYYSFNLDYNKTSELARRQPFFFSERETIKLSDWKGYLDPTVVRSNGYVGIWNNSNYYTWPENTSYQRHARSIEDSIGTRTYASQIADFKIPDDVSPYETPWNYTRPSIEEIEKILAGNIEEKRSEGTSLFTPVFKAAPNGFLVSWALDYDVNFDDKIEDISGGRLLSTYWPKRLGNKHPLRDIYDMYYNPTGDGRYWDQFYDKNYKVIRPYSNSPYHQFIQGRSDKNRLDIDFRQNNEPDQLVLGPVSNSDIAVERGNKVIAASPVMTPVIHRMTRLSDESGSRRNDEFRADTILYPSPVGAFGSNTLSLGEGNHVVYYDSSFSEIKSKGGDSVYLPSFGSFNWSIDWIPGLNGRTIDNSKKYIEEGGFDPTWLPPSLEKEQGPALISPIPWDAVPVDPKEGINSKKRGKSYAAMMAEFSWKPARGNLNNQKNYLYTVFSKRGGSYAGDERDKEILKTYLNLKQDTKDDDPGQSRNPVNRLGGVDISAGKRNDKRGQDNYLEPSGNNVFFGMDWEFWKDSLPGQGSTLANNPAGVNGQKRPAQHEWNTLTMAGGRGNNTFNLGNVMDNITNNGLFYNGKASYLLSLTHDDIYSREAMLDEGMAFGNAFNEPDDDQSPYLSTVNLNLQADTTSYEMMIQAADAGQPGVTKNAGASAWLGAVGWAQKAIKTPFDLNKDYVEYAKLQPEKEVNLLFDWTDGEVEFVEGELIKVEKQPKPATWLSKSKFFSRTLGTAFPMIDLAIGTFSMVKGLYDWFTAKPERAPKQELKSVFLEAGLQPANKAVVINDWHPGAKVNLNLPSISASDWSDLSISVKQPDSTSSDYRRDGAYVQVGRMTTTPSSTGAPSEKVSKDWPLVVFQNMDKKDRVDQVQNNDGGFAYYTYSFVDPDNSAELQKDQFNPIRSSSLKMFARLADTSKLLGEDGKPLNVETFGDQFVYRAENGFDMRYDAENYVANEKALQDSQGKNPVYRYSKYYFDDKFAGKEGLRSDFNASQDIYPYTSNISIEFDSRVHGWYWQPVSNTDLVTADQLGTVDPASLPLDYEDSKLWINKPEGWTSYSFSELDNNIEAFRYSRLATTFYATSTDKDKDGVSDGQEEINRRLRFDRQLKLLEEYGDSLYDIDQRLISSDTNLFSLNQIKKVEEVNKLEYDGQTINDALVVTFETAMRNGDEIKRKLILHKRDGVAQRALLATNELEAIPVADFSFNVLVDRNNPNQEYVFDPNNRIAPAVRTFAGVYNEKKDKTHLFEYVPFPKDDQDGLAFDESREAARNRQLPSSLSTSESVSSYLATIDNAEENDAITGWFKGKAWLGADNMGDDEQIKDKEGLYLQEDHNLWQWLDGKNERKPFWINYFNNRLLEDRPIDNRYSNWAAKGTRYESYRQVLSIDGETGSWEQNFSNLPLYSDINGYVVEYTPFQGLPSFV